MTNKVRLIAGSRDGEPGRLSPGSRCLRNRLWRFEQTSRYAGCRLYRWAPTLGDRYGEVNPFRQVATVNLRTAVHAERGGYHPDTREFTPINVMHFTFEQEPSNSGNVGLRSAVGRATPPNRRNLE